jgi:SAM-dependent methyltransferase
LPVIATTIIPGVYDTAELVRFYDHAYTQDPAEAELYSRWRALGAVGKADHVKRLCREGRVRPASVLEVGCGDGALLCELHRRGFCEQLSGVEITASAVEIARARPGIRSVTVYDGAHLPFAGQAFELGILSHVLEHVPDPAALLAEVARVCGAVVVEVPLEANWSARRRGKREHAAEVGHLQRLSRRDVREIVARAGLSVAAELEDPLPLRAHRFFARTPAGRARAGAKWALRRSVHRLSPALARRAFTLHYACLCLPRDA